MFKFCSLIKTDANDFTLVSGLSKPNNILIRHFAGQWIATCSISMGELGTRSAGFFLNPRSPSAFKINGTNPIVNNVGPQQNQGM